MSGGGICIAGIPTAPDVDRLEKEFGIPEEGVLIPWEAIEAACGSSRGEHRFATVVTAWRRRLSNKHNVILGPVPGKGLVRLNANERIELAVSKRQSGFRFIGKSVRISTMTDKSRLTPENLRAAEHNERVASAIKLAIGTAAKPQELPSIGKK